jgi:hypothetical protein
MAALATLRERYGSTLTTEQYELPGHTVQKPRLFLQKRTVAPSPTSVAQHTASVIQGTEDADGNIIAPKIVIGCNARVPVQVLDSDTDLAVADFRAFVASDEFVDFVKSQSWIGEKTA